jgi:hypothetical protein
MRLAEIQRMRNRHFVCLLFFLGLVVISNAQQQQPAPPPAPEQQECLEPGVEEKCIGLTKAILDDYVFLHSRAFNSAVSSDVEFYVPLKKGVNYVFYIYEKGAGAAKDDGMVISLADAEDKVVASSVDLKTKKNTKVISYTPTQQGKYYLKTKFVTKDEKCCLITFGMIKKKQEAATGGKKKSQ